jgi:hypothetical protein
MSGVTLPQFGIAPILAGHTSAAGRCPAGALEFIVRRAIAHRVVDGDFLAGMNAVKSDNDDLPVETGIRFATVVDEVRRLVGRDRGEIESLLDLDRMLPDLVRELVERLGRDDAAAPDGNKLAGFDMSRA